MKNKNYLSNTNEFKKKIKTISCDLKNLNNIQSKIIKFKPEIIIPEFFSEENKSTSNYMCHRLKNVCIIKSNKSYSNLQNIQ